MEWAEYKQLCDKPNYMSRNLIETTAALSNDMDQTALALSLHERIAVATPLERPVDHRGDERSHMFEVNFSEVEADEVLRVLDEVARKGSARYILGSITGIRAAWFEYRRWLANRHVI